MLVPVLCAFMACGCTEATDGEGHGGMGEVRFACGVAAGIATADGATRTLPAEMVPEAGELSLAISGSDGEVLSYDAFADYDSPKLLEGEYTATFTYGDMEREGADAACFSGEETFSIVARTTAECSVSVALANAAVTASLSEWFGKYYESYDIRVTTASGTEVACTEYGEPEAAPVFVQADTELYFSGTAVKTNGAEVSFPETMIGTAAARTWHTVVIDAGQAGGAGITIQLDDTPVDVVEIPVELNPNV